MTNELKEANNHIELLSKLADSNNTLPIIMKKPNSNIEKKKVTTPMNTNSKCMPNTLVDMNLTKLTFTEASDQSSKLNSITKDLPNESNKEKIMDRLLKSVNMVKEVLQSNLQLREQVQELTQRLEVQNAELCSLQSENEEQKEKLQIIMSFDDPNLTSEENEKKKQKINMAERILQLEKEKTMLQKRIDNLEIENTRIHTNKYISQPGTDDFEPVRSLVNDSNAQMLIPIKEFPGYSSNSESNNKDIRGTTKYSSSKVRNRGQSIINYNPIGKLWMYNTTIENFGNGSAGYKPYKRGASTALREGIVRNYINKTENIKYQRSIPIVGMKTITESRGGFNRDLGKYNTIEKKGKKSNSNNQIFFDNV